MFWVSQFLTAVQSLKLFRKTKVDVWRDCQLSSFGSACWKHCLVKQPRGIFRVMKAKDSFRPSHILTLVYLSQSTMFRPTFPKALIQPNPTSHLRRRCGSDPSDPQRTGAVTRTHSVDLDWLFGRVTLDHSILIKFVRTNDQLANILTEGMCTTMQRHSVLHLWQKQTTL